MKRIGKTLPYTLACALLFSVELAAAEEIPDSPPLNAPRVAHGATFEGRLAHDLIASANDLDPWPLMIELDTFPELLEKCYILGTATANSTDQRLIIDTKIITCIAPEKFFGVNAGPIMADLSAQVLDENSIVGITGESDALGTYGHNFTVKENTKVKVIVTQEVLFHK